MPQRILMRKDIGISSVTLHWNYFMVHERLRQPVNDKNDLQSIEVVFSLPLYSCKQTKYPIRFLRSYSNKTTDLHLTKPLFHSLVPVHSLLLVAFYSLGNLLGRPSSSTQTTSSSPPLKLFSPDSRRESAQLSLSSLSQIPSDHHQSAKRESLADSQNALRRRRTQPAAAAA